MPSHKYIFVIGGVMSGVGKGITTSSIAKILQSKGFKINPIKVDPYLNVDAGTMNPTEHGEVFVLKSGLETDQDMGNYERFLNTDLGDENYMTSGTIYKYVIEKERSLGYKGKCVEAIPHIRDEIVRRFEKATEINKSDISIIEIGGTVGDYQNIMFIEAARVLKLKNPNDVLFVLVSYAPLPAKIGEMKTKPTQNAMRALNGLGVQADMVVVRSEGAMDGKRKEKIAISCNVMPENVISAPDVLSIYDVPINFEKDNLGERVLALLNIKKKSKVDMKEWRAYLKKIKTARKKVKIGIVGKYFDTGDFVLSDAYISVIEALKFSSYNQGAKPELSWLNAKSFEKGANLSVLGKFDGILIPGGFGETGVEGKIKAIEYARKNKIPYFGLCYGMQLMLVEYARNVLHLKNAHTIEIDENTPHPVIDVMPEQKKILETKDYGGTMRLGSYPCIVKKGSIAREAYGKHLIHERHRHRYEVNPEYIEKFTQKGMLFSGVSPDDKLMEIAELSRNIHPFFLGTQFHPEFQARPLAPHPLFNEFIKSALRGKGRQNRVDSRR